MIDDKDVYIQIGGGNCLIPPDQQGGDNDAS